MTTIRADLLRSALDDADLYDVRIRDYSGRAMYGRSCVGLTGDSSDVFAAIAAIALAQDELGIDAIDIARRARTDSMGLGMVLYFPGLELEDQIDPEDG